MYVSRLIRVLLPCSIGTIGLSGVWDEVFLITFNNNMLLIMLFHNSQVTGPR